VAKMDHGMFWCCQQNGYHIHEPLLQSQKEKKDTKQPGDVPEMLQDICMLIKNPLIHKQSFMQRDRDPYHNSRR